MPTTPNVEACTSCCPKGGRPDPKGRGSRPRTTRRYDGSLVGLHVEPHSFSRNGPPAPKSRVRWRSSHDDRDVRRVARESGPKGRGASVPPPSAPVAPCRNGARPRRLCCSRMLTLESSSPAGCPTACAISTGSVKGRGCAKPFSKMPQTWVPWRSFEVGHVLAVSRSRRGGAAARPGGRSGCGGDRAPRDRVPGAARRRAGPSHSSRYLPLYRRGAVHLRLANQGGTTARAPDAVGGACREFMEGGSERWYKLLIDQAVLRGITQS